MQARLHSNRVLVMDSGRIVHSQPVAPESTHRGSIQGSPWYWRSFTPPATDHTMASQNACTTPISIALRGQDELRESVILPLPYPALVVQECSHETAALVYDVKILIKRLTDACAVRVFTNISDGLKSVVGMKAMRFLPIGSTRSWLALAPEYVDGCGHFLESSDDQGKIVLSRVLHTLKDGLLSYRAMCIA